MAARAQPPLRQTSRRFYLEVDNHEIAPDGYCWISEQSAEKVDLEGGMGTYKRPLTYHF
ncbi:hypothetical protein BDP81DRAFT_410046 [Colletotrichum phormii]|uniref:Uncharacterized protein n=1 Tax=Colletotrichum phormii TaxID=359342 RepID=A0AAI9ZIV1_9PEZI|nr:uncharacterized protein BDP81DRAFT_410046 [Colletotrichum phormii]KAK1624114.1 hypothetical protein BDP81DRAFT_410046 [Colletotrichum phormii]